MYEQRLWKATEYVLPASLGRRSLWSADHCHSAPTPAVPLQLEPRYLRVLLQCFVHLRSETPCPHAVHYENGGATGVAGYCFVNH